MYAKKSVQRHAIDFVFVILLLGLFVLSGILLIIFGSNIYQNILISMEQNTEQRTARAYITQKVRQGQIRDGIHVATWNGLSVLEITDEIDGTVYVTKLYAEDGMLKELFEEEGADLPSFAGSDVTQVSDITFQEIDGGIVVHLVTENGFRENFVLHTISDDDSLSK